MTLELMVMLVGFCLAAYSIVANDAIQTLGTFLSSNSQRHWVVLWLYACSILTLVMLYTYLSHDGDLTYGRLGALFHHTPRGQVTWLHVVPPLLILVMTRFGWPVSTTFLVLTVFSPQSLDKMLLKSVSGYGMAFILGLVIYLVVSKSFERRCLDTRDQPAGVHWVILQWCSTAWLWTQWLIQDLANIFVFLPFERRVDATGQVSTYFSVEWFIFSLALMWGIHAFIFASRGGEIQKIVTSKTNTTDIRSATIIDFLYGGVLYVFTWSTVPMSTTWVFIGLLAGRELAMTLQRVAIRTPAEIARVEHREMTEGERRVGATQDQEASADDVRQDVFKRSLGDTLRVVGFDVAKAGAGLTISVLLAFGLPAIYVLVMDQPLVPTK